jgi:predicted DNA helicase
MKKVIITGFSERIGPGDIVGAFINEAGIKAEQIGNIKIKNGIATVEIDDHIQDKLIDKMKDRTIAGEKINIKPVSERLPETNQKVNKYIAKFTELVEKERREEMQIHENEIRQLSGKQREKKGRAILHLKGKDQGTGLGNKFLIKYMRQRQGEQLPENEINVGDLVMLSKNRPLADDNPTGTVIEKTKYSITVVFDSKPPKFVSKKRLRMDLYVNDITFQRMLDSLDEMQNASGHLADLRNKIIGIIDVHPIEPVDVEPFNEQLNQSQLEAVEKAMGARDVFLIHGPPGTGKTITCIEVIQQAIKQGKTVLATADSNVAVDNIVEWLVKRGVEAVRVGHPARVNPLLRKHTLDFMLEDNELYQKAQEFRQEAMELNDKQEKYTHPGGKWRRGMSDQQIRDLAYKGRGSRGVSHQKIQEMADWLDLQDQIDEYFKKIDHLEGLAVNQTFDSAEVICTTNSTAGSEILEDHHFDLLVHDEATQSTEPSTLIPLTKADKIVMAGDHKQLPPTILNQKAQVEGLEKSLFERVLEVHGNKIKSMLQVQYRMHQDIMQFPSRQFYTEKLIAAEKVRSWTLADLNIKVPEGRFDSFVFDPELPVVFLDTVEKDPVEESIKDSKSYRNKTESKLAVKILNTAVNIGIDPQEVALISPYKDQVDLIDSQVSDEKIEVDTVDGFQGREKELIILSLVRTNQQGNIGFLKDLRRLNVSITRAKKKLVIIGHSRTISSNRIYRELMSYVKQKNGYYVLN